MVRIGKRFLDRCAAAEQGPFQHLACIATTLVAMGRNDEALNLCRAAAAAGESGGYRSNGQKFTDLLAALIERRREPAARTQASAQ